MNDKIFISDDELAEFGDVQNLSQRAASLLEHQKANWDLVKDNFSALKSVKIKRYDFDQFYVNTQFNSSRIKSSTAKVDKKSIEDRACFLCEENLPSVQKGINYKNKYILLCNPYPIFKQHLTIPHHKHVPQSIDNHLSDFLELAYDLKDNFFVFYNGPKCGASAPDHLHFQAGLRNSTPLEDYYEKLAQNGITYLSEVDIKVTVLQSLILNMVYIKSNTMSKMEIIFSKILNALKALEKSDEEPLLNIISFYGKESWHLFIIPRKKHRPDQFFLEGESKILISPASVDMAGLLITPREEDFERLSKQNVQNIYEQVIFDNSLFNELLSELK